MAQLFTLKGAKLKDVYDIRKQVTIGNLPICDIFFADINSAEMPVQIEIQERDSRYVLCKKQGNIPLLVNGKEIQETILVHRDTISIADIVFLFNQVTRENILYDSDTSSSDLLAMLPPEEREKNQITTFYRLFNLSFNTFSMRELLQNLASFLLETFQATTTTIFLKHGENAHFRPVVHKRQNSQLNCEIIKISPSIKALQLAIKKKKAILCREHYENNYSLFMLAPLLYQNEVLGIIAVEVQKDKQIFVQDSFNKTFSVVDLYMLGGIALLIANTIVNIQHYMERKSHIQRLEFLNKIAVKLSSLLDVHTIYRETAKEVARLLKCTKCSVVYLSEDSQLRIGYAVGISKEEAQHILIEKESLVGWVVKHGKILWSSALPENLKPSAREKYHSVFFLIVPIFKKSGKSFQPIGAICVTDRIKQSPFTRYDKELLGFIASRMSIALSNASLYEQATVDFLTKLYVRGYFLEKLTDTVEQKQHFPLSLLMMDIDFFKNLNDTYGHQKGDVVLQELGCLIKNSIRENDIAGRYGGEEFLILLRSTRHDEALIIAERIREAVEKFNFDAGKSPLHITVSIGVTEYCPEEPIQDFLSRCDSALYRAKNQGRNRVL